MSDVPEDLEDDEIWNRFNDQSDVGDFYFLYQSWSAWSVLTEEKSIAPIAHIVIGDRRGDILLNRPIVLTGVADLLHELAKTAEREIAKIAGMEGFSIDLPNEPSVMLENLEGAKAHIANALEILKKLNLHGPDEEVEKNKPEETNKPAGNEPPPS